MQNISAYKLKDGTIIEDQKRALDYCENKMGEELDGILKTVNIGIREKMALMRAMLDKPKEVALMAAWLNEYSEVKHNDL
jgi:hypothetical protein